MLFTSHAVPSPLTETLLASTRRLPGFDGERSEDYKEVARRYGIVLYWHRDLCTCVFVFVRGPTVCCELFVVDLLPLLFVSILPSSFSYQTSMYNFTSTHL